MWKEMIFIFVLERRNERQNNMDGRIWKIQGLTETTTSNNGISSKKYQRFVQFY